MQGVKNLFERMPRMVAHGPVFCDITWGAGGTTADVTLDIAKRMQNEVGVETMMHLTCTNMPAEKVDEALAACKEVGVSNILALRGDPPKGEEKFVAVEGGFECALDLVKHIKAGHGDHYGLVELGPPGGGASAARRRPAGAARAGRAGRRAGGRGARHLRRGCAGGRTRRRRRAARPPRRPGSSAPPSPSRLPPSSLPARPGVEDQLCFWRAERQAAGCGWEGWEASQGGERGGRGGKVPAFVLS